MTATSGDMEERPTPVFVIEDPPPATRRRWYCAGSDGFDTPEEAVGWALSHERSVIVRTLAGTFYWAGERPPDWVEERQGGALRSWPPPAGERERIDAEYEAAVGAMHDDARTRDAYERERIAWLRINAPALTEGAPYHECLVLLPDNEKAAIEFEEFVPGGKLCGARQTRVGRHAFGDAATVLAATAERARDDAWLAAVCAASHASSPLEASRPALHAARRAR
jgi:hypothetical protein